MWCQSSKPVKHPIFPVCIFYFAPLKSGTKKPKVNPICGNEILGKTNLLTVVMVVRRCSLDVIFKRSFPCLYLLKRIISPYSLLLLQVFVA